MHSLLCRLTKAILKQQTMKKSAGLLLYKQIAGQFQFFLVHPGGPFWKNKDLGSWSIPKGELVEDEDALETAKREFQEETGIISVGVFVPLTPLKQKSGKIIYAWALEMDIDAARILSNEFKMEWPPRSGQFKFFPEVDRGGWFLAAEAKQKINPSQAAFIDELVAKL